MAQLMALSITNAEGHNGRLKVWLAMIDAPLKRANDALEDMEAALNLWAKPAVKVDRGMHLFTLATEQEHKVFSRPICAADSTRKDARFCDSRPHCWRFGFGQNCAAEQPNALYGIGNERCERDALRSEGR